MIPDLLHRFLGKLLFVSVDRHQYRGPRVAGADFHLTTTLPRKCLIQNKQNSSYGISYRIFHFKSTANLRVKEHLAGIRMELILQGQLQLQHNDGSISFLSSGNYFFTSRDNYALRTVNKDKSISMVLYIDKIADPLSDKDKTLLDNKIYVLSDQMRKRVDDIILHSFNDKMLDEFYENSIREIFFHHFFSNAERYASIMEDSYLSNVFEAGELISEDITRKFSILKLSRMTATNEFTLKREFRRYYNSSIGDMLIAKRLQQAKILLATTDDDLTSISAAVGYKSLSSFMKAFRRALNLTPTQWRAQNKNYQP